MTQLHYQSSKIVRIIKKPNKQKTKKQNLITLQIKCRHQMDACKNPAVQPPGWRCETFLTSWCSHAQSQPVGEPPKLATDFSVIMYSTYYKLYFSKISVVWTCVDMFVSGFLCRTTCLYLSTLSVLFCFFCHAVIYWELHVQVWLCWIRLTQTCLCLVFGDYVNFFHLSTYLGTESLLPRQTL